MWPGSVHYPDFFSPVTAAYWEAELRAFFALAQYDGARVLGTAGHCSAVKVVALHCYIIRLVGLRLLLRVMHVLDKGVSEAHHYFY